MAINEATISSDEIYVGSSTGVVLTDYLDGLETDVSNKAAAFRKGCRTGKQVKRKVQETHG